MAKRTIIDRVADVVSSATLFDLSFKPYGSNILVAYDRIVAINHDNACDKVTFLVRIGSNEAILQAFLLPSAGSTMVVEGPVFVTGNGILTIRYEGASVGDKVEAFAYGFVENLRMQ